MKKRQVNRVLSLLIALVVLAGLLPIQNISVNAEEIIKITDVNMLNSLGRGFNLLGDEDLEIDTIAHKQILAKLNVNAERRTNPETTYASIYINDMSSYLQSLSSSFSASIETSATFKLVTIGAKAKFGLSERESSTGMQATEYFSLEVNRTCDYQFIGLETSKEIKSLWSEEGVLDQEFIETIRGIGDDKDLENFFKLYGTHIITSYNSGGTANVTYSGTSLSSHISNSSTANANVAVNIGTVGNFASLNTELNSTLEENSGNTSSNKNINVTAHSKGGKTVDPSTFNGTTMAIESYVNSVDSDSTILVDKNLSLLPIWELLVLEEDKDLKIRMEEYFNAHVTEQNADFYSKYIYRPISDVDYTGYTFITTPDEFNNIRNDLNGKYVLLCDIDLSKFEEWAPIGSIEKPFTGIFDGKGNAVKGLNIANIQGENAIGLFGCNDGVIRNVIVSGNINANVTQTTGYVGGIVGYNQGHIQECLNMVNVKGSMTISGNTSSSANGNENWFDTNANAIQAALETETTEASDDTIYKTFPLKLTGKAKNISISVPDSGKVAYIILDNAEISGQIYSIGDNTRPICIISVGTENKISAPTSNSAVNAPNANLYICGDATLTIIGGVGKDGTKGADATGYDSDGKKGKDGSNGENGENGFSGINASSLYTSISEIIIQGGNGGNGGDGGNGAVGKDISGTCASNYATSSSCRGATGGAGGNGGSGGNGGNGSAPLSTNQIYLYNNSSVTLNYGNNGNGGNGGNGAAGGRGQNGANGWCVAGIEPGHAGGHGGVGGAGGAGGNGGATIFVDYKQFVSAYDSSSLLITAPDKMLGNGGDGGDGAKGGSGGKGGAEIHNWFYDIGQHPGVAGNGGNGGKGGDGGKGGNGYVPGNGGEFGLGGDLGSRGYTEDNCGKNGSKGADGKLGEAGTKDIGAVATTPKVFLKTKRNEYALYIDVLTWTDAQQKASLQDSEIKLVSIGSAREQELLNNMLSNTNGGNYWIGLNRSTTKGYNIFTWEDSTIIKVEEDTFGSDAHVIRIDENKEYICDAYSNWADGQPDNFDSIEKYICISKDGKWSDTVEDDGAISGYITEKLIFDQSENSYKDNSLNVGGIAGFNEKDAEITNCKNEGTIYAGKAHSENSGVSSYAGGITGYNEGTVSLSLNSGKVTSFAVSSSIDSVADSYALNIGFNGGTITDCKGEADTESIAVSANALTNQHENLTQKEIIDNDPSFDLEALWANRQMRIEKFINVTYKTTDSFDRSTIEVTLNGKTIPQGKYLTNYYFGKNNTVAEIAISYDGYTRTVLALVKDAEDKIIIKNDSSYTKENGFIFGVKIGTSVSKLLSNLENTQVYVYDKNGNIVADDALSCTGYTIKLVYNGEVLDSLTVVILGDVDGSGTIDSTDYLRIKGGFLGTYKLEGEYLLAADIDQSNSIDTTDYLRVKGAFLGTYVL